MSTAGFHITEDCAEVYLQNESGAEFLQLARRLHDYLMQGQRLPARSLFEATDGCKEISREAFDALAKRRIHFVALRYFNACGAHLSGKIGEAHNPETHLIPIVLQVPNGQRDHVSIFGDDYPTRDGTCVRDYIHVTDLASAHILAAEYLMNGGENNVFNLGNGVGFTVKEIIDTAEKVVGKPIKCEMAARRAGDPAQLVASSEKAKTVLGWKPKYDDIETIIRSAWNWHKEHPHGYED